MIPSSRQSQIETAVAIALWAVSFPLIKIALQDISPITLIVLRFSLGGFILFFFTSWKGLWRTLNWSDFPPITGLGLVGVTVHQLLQVTGQATSTAGAAAFLASTAPAFIVLLGAIFLKERLGLLQTGGVLMATAGALVISAGDLTDWVNYGQFLEPGNLLVLASAVVWAIFTILNRIVGSNRPPLVTASGMMLVGIVFCLPIWIFQKGWLELKGLTLMNWINLFVIGIICTGLAHLIYTQALQRAPASRLAAIQNIEPIIAVIASVILLGETIHPAFVTGGVLILVGVILAERSAISD